MRSYTNKVNSTDTYNIIAKSAKYGLALVLRERDDRIYLNRYDGETGRTSQLYSNHLVNAEDTELFMEAMQWFRDNLAYVHDMIDGKSSKKAKNAKKAKKAKKAKSKVEAPLPPEPEAKPEAKKAKKMKGKEAFSLLKKAFKLANKQGKATVVAWYMDGDRKIRCHVSALDADKQRVYVAKHHKARPGGKTGRWVKAKLVRVW